MAVFGIRSGDYSGEVSTTGAGLRLVSYRGALLTETWDEGSDETSDSAPPLSAGLVLAPWPNRTADGYFEFDGQAFQLDINEKVRNNANHGFVRTMQWQVVEHDADELVVKVPIGIHPGWPFRFELISVYSVDARDGLTVTHSAENVGDRRAPFALGQHTFVRLGDAPIDDCSLQLAATEILPLDPERRLPAGDPIPVDGTDMDFTRPRTLRGRWLDTPFTGMVQSGDRFIHRLIGSGGDAAELWTDLSFGWVQVFTADPARGQGYPDRGRALAIEPMSAPPNALASGDDLIVVEPGQRWSGSWGLRYVASVPANT